MTAGVAGSPVTLDFLFIDETTGLPADPSSVQLDITYGSEIGFTGDVAGPFLWLGATAPIAGQVWRSAIGTFHAIWVVPGTALDGVYVANWTATYGGVPFLGFENFPVSGGAPLGGGTPQGDIGYWTGGIVYTPPVGSTTQYDVASVPFGAVDDSGIAWLANKLDGWDSPDVQGAGVIPKAGDHGAIAAPQYYAARNLTLTLTAMAPNQAARDQARAQLQEAVPVSDLALLTWNEPVPKQMQVRRSGRISESYPDLGSVQFQVGLVAPDPRKYATIQQSLSTANAGPALGVVLPVNIPFTLANATPSGAVAPINAGAFETRPIITLKGPWSNPGLLNARTGQLVSWTGLTLRSTDLLVADFNTTLSFLNGVWRPADVSSAWWTLPPGQTTVQGVGQPGTGSSMQVAWSDAWI